MSALSPFQEMVKRDMDNVFLNSNEFAETHTIEDIEILAVIDTNDHLELSGGEKLGISRESIRIFAKIEDLPRRRDEGGSLNVDGREYMIDSWVEEMGMAVISLSQARSH